MHKFKVGDRVRFKGMGDTCHAYAPRYYPKDGTIGNITSKIGKYDAFVQWPEGSTSMDDIWCAPLDCLELVENDPA